jgi:glycosyltransferase involved in cell wall biosynthesis
VRVGVIVECAATFVCDEVAALRAAGVDVAVASAFRPAPDWEGAFGGAVAYPPKSRGRWVTRALRDGARAGARLAPVIHRAVSEGAPLRLSALAAGLARRARRERWSHVHASFATFPAWLAAATGRLARIPFSVTAHAYDVQEPRPWLPRVLDEAAFVRAICEDTAASLRALARSPEAAARVRVGYLGVDVQRFRPHEAPPSSPREILCVARLGPTKGIELLVDATAEMAAPSARVARFRVRILGDGPLRAALLRRIEERNLGEWVTLEGSATPDAVAAALRSATAFALPCVPVSGGARHDGLPVALLEAMASGLPVVSTPVGGIPEAILHDRNGLLVAPGDASALASALTTLLADAPLRRRLGVAARTTVLTRFRSDRAAARLAAWLAEPARAPGVRPAVAAVLSGGKGA